MSKDGGPAFPTTKPLESWDDPNRGMMLRDYLAAQAMIGMGMWCPGEIWPDVDEAQRRRAEWAYGQADAMIAARAKP